MGHESSLLWFFQGGLAVRQVLLHLFLTDTSDLHCLHYMGLIIDKLVTAKSSLLMESCSRSLPTDLWKPPTDGIIWETAATYWVQTSNTGCPDAHQLSWVFFGRTKSFSEDEYLTPQCKRYLPAGVSCDWSLWKFNEKTCLCIHKVCWSNVCATHLTHFRRLQVCAFGASFRRLTVRIESW